MTWTMSTRPRSVAIKSFGIIDLSVLAGVSAECDRTGKSGRTDATHGREPSNYRPARRVRKGWHHRFSRRSSGRGQSGGVGARASLLGQELRYGGRERRYRGQNLAGLSGGELGFDFSGDRRKIGPSRE